MDDSVVVDEQNEVVTIMAGDGTGPIVSLVGDTTSESFGWRVTALEDINGDGRSDVLVAAPGVMVDSILVGGFYAFDATTGLKLWSRTFPAQSRGGMGCVLVPDQNGDGFGEILAPLLIDEAGQTVSVSVMLSSQTGQILGYLQQPFSEAFAQAIAGQYLIAPGDLNGSGVAEIGDFLMVLDLAAVGDPVADVTGDGVIDGEDIVQVATDVAEGVAVGDENPTTSPLGVLVLHGVVDGGVICAEWEDELILAGGGAGTSQSIADPCGSIDCTGCTHFEPPPPSYGLPIVILPGCNDPRLLQALNDPRIREIIRAAQLQCSLTAGDAGIPCWGQIRISCSTKVPCDDSTKTRMPPHIEICIGDLLPGDLGKEQLVNTLAHELTHARQLCQDPDHFYTGGNNAICAEIEAYCAMPINQGTCQTPQGRCNLACLSAKVKWRWCFGDSYTKCVNRCLSIEGDCDRGYYKP